jgi:hypothetical protein
MFLAYDGPEVHLDVPMDMFVWFRSVEDALGFLRNVLPYCSWVLGNLEPNPEGETLSGRISAVVNRWELPTTVDDVNAILAGKWKILWAGPFSDLVAQLSDWPSRVRESFHDDGDDEADADGGRPILADEEEAFVQFLQEWGA